jgi:hypothetical protein
MNIKVFDSNFSADYFWDLKKIKGKGVKEVRVARE